MRIWAYLKTSQDRQDIRKQKQVILEFAEKVHYRTLFPSSFGRQNGVLCISPRKGGIGDKFPMTFGDFAYPRMLHFTEVMSHQGIKSYLTNTPEPLKEGRRDINGVTKIAIP